MPTTKRATLEETLAFCSRVREAGGMNALDALMPAIPENSEQCFIARNLNFNCSISIEIHNNKSVWVMYLEDEDLCNRISEALQLEKGKIRFPHLSESGAKRHYYVVLPPEIGQVANDFDNAMELITEKFINTNEFAPMKDVKWKLGRLGSKQKGILLEFWPYIEESIKETYKNATFINEKGELVL